MLDGAARALFPPLHSSDAAARETLLHWVRRDPRTCGVERTRWSLASLRGVLPGLAHYTVAGVERLLRRYGVVLKRGRLSVHSPDPAYEAKLAYLTQVRAACANSRTQRALYLDEVTFYRQPTVSVAYEARGHTQPLVRLSHRADTQTRYVATLDLRDGRVCYRRAARVRLATLVAFWQQLVAAYPQQRLYLLLDNWPVHFHPDILAALESQQWPWPWSRPSNWPATPSPAAVQRWGDLQLPIQLVALPTYASWTNPIEKLWRKARQDVSHHHSWADDLPTLRQQLDAFFDQFAFGSPQLLTYVGLNPV